MKKVININFHGRVVPIEETAYEILQQYIESLRGYFANEEGRDEIISDIENRFSELFGENLKKGAVCITDADVNVIITSMGRPEEFEEEDGTASSGRRTDAGAGAQGQANQAGADPYVGPEPRRLYRAENDKILGGVCAGLANYLRIDPAIVRIIFVLMTFGGGFGFLLYIVLWAVLPYKSLAANIRKRLYRNPDDRVIGGVASGLAAYFHIEVWIPRLIFALPLILGVLTSILRSTWFDFNGPVFFTGGFGGTVFITYIVFWIVLPEAQTASEKLEMRGEKVDLESIKNTIKSDIETFNKKAKDMGAEMKESFQKAGERMKKGTQNFASEAGPIIHKTNNGIGHAIGVLFKAFFLFIAGCIAFALIMLLAGLAFRGDGLLHLKDFILAGFWQNFLAWTSFVLFLVIPIIALLTWLIRRITGVRSRSHYLGYTFATLWVIGLFCFIALVGMVMRNFRTQQHVEEPFAVTQPTHGKLIVQADKNVSRFYDEDNDWWFDDFNWRRNTPFYSLSADSLLLTTIRVNVLKSEDSSYHVQVLRFSRGNDAQIAHDLAQQIVFPVRQSDSILYLPHGFSIPRGQKFRNQKVLVALSIPVGRKIFINSNIKEYKWFSISGNGRHIRWNNSWDDDWNRDWDEPYDMSNSFSWTGNVEYVMTPDGLSQTGKKATDKIKEEKRRRDAGEDDNQDDQPEYHDKKRDAQPGDKPGTPGYRYKGPDRPKTNRPDSPAVKSTASVSPALEQNLLSVLFN
jgi:phage shock protein PspC (stress-responsive transcriptional regulator)